VAPKKTREARLQGGPETMSHYELSLKSGDKSLQWIYDKIVIAKRKRVNLEIKDIYW